MATSGNKRAHNHGTRRGRCVPWVGWFLVWFCLCSAGQSQSTAVTETSPAASLPALPATEPAGDVSPLRFRRVFVPRDVLDQVRDPVPYFPLNAAEFEKMVAATNRQVFFRGQNARIVTAIYRANIRENDLIGLEGEWFVELVNGASAILPLGKLNIALSDPVWADLGGTQVSLLTNQEGNVSLYVERSGKVGFRWSSHGRAVGATGAIRFDLTFPPAIRNELELYTSDRYDVTAEGALVFPIPSSFGGVLGYRLVINDPSRFGMVLQPRRPVTRVIPRGDYREEIAYELTIHGLEGTWQWLLDVLDSPLDALTIDVPAGFRVVEVSLGDVILPWEYVDENAPATSAVRVKFPEPLVGRNRRVTLRGLTHLPLESPFVLPTLRVKELFWRSGMATIVVRAPLAIKNLSFRTARLRDVSTSSSGLLGTVLEVIHDSPAAETELVCRIAPPGIDQTAVAMARIGRQEVRADVRLAVRGEDDSCFELAWAIAPGWRVLNVSSSDSSLLESWQVKESGTPGQGGTLVVRLKKALPVEKAALFTIAARRDSPAWERPVFFDDLVPLLVSAWPSDGRLYGSITLDSELAAASAIELEPNVEPVSPVELNAVGGLYEVGSSTRLFDVMEMDVRPRVRLAAKQVRYHARVDGKIQIEGKELVQSFDVTVEPDQTAVDEVCTLWSEPGVERDFTWRLVESDGRETPLEIVDQSFGPCRVAKGAVIRLPKPYQEPFVLRARRRSAAQAGKVPLLLLPKATRYEALVSVTVEERRGTGKATVGHWRAKGLQLVDRTTLAGGPGRSIVAAYRYQSSSDSGPESIPTLELFSQESTIPAGTWAVRGIVALRLDASGLLERWHIFEMDMGLDDRLTIRRSSEEPLPDEMIVLVDDQQVPFQIESNTSEPQIVVQVPRQRQRQRLTVWERFSQPSLFLAYPLQVRRLEPDFPVKEWQTTVWLPPVHVGLKLSDFADWGVFWRDWTFRLFGPLKRPPDQPLFLPDQINRMLFDPSLPPPNLSVKRAMQFQEELGKQLEAVWHVAGSPTGLKDSSSQKPAGASSAIGPTRKETSAAETPQKATPSGVTTGKSILWRDLMSDEFLDRVHSLPPGIRTVVFLIDLEAFENLGIQPFGWIRMEQPQVFSQSVDPMLRAEKFLNEYELALVIAQSAVVLTSLSTTAIHRDEIQWADPPMYKLDPHSQWWREIESAVAAGDGRRYCRIRLWNDFPSRVGPVEDTVSDPGISFAAQGWNATSLAEDDFERSDHVTLLILRNGVLETTRWLGLLIAFAVSWLTGFQHRLRILAAIVVVAVLILFVPPPFVPLVSGFFLGGILAFATSLLVSSRGTERTDTEIGNDLAPRPGITSSTTGGEKGGANSLELQPKGMRAVSPGLLAVLLLITSEAFGHGVVPNGQLPSSPLVTSAENDSPFRGEPIGRSRAGGDQGLVRLVTWQATQTSEPSSTPSGSKPATPQPSGSLPPPYRVFIPVDETGKPVGQEVYVPEGLYKELQKRSSPTAAKPTGWHFVSATYRGTLAAAPTGERWELTQLTANFECWATDAPAQIEIPIGSSEAVPQINDTLLDGRPVAATWDQSRLRVIVTETGRYRLQVPIALTPRTDAGVSEVRFQIPSIANARLELAAPFSINRVEIPSAQGRVENDPESGRWTAELGAVSELIIRWPSRSDPLSDTGPQADLLYTLRLTPSQVIWEMRWKLRLNNARIDQLRLSSDPNLRLDRMVADGQVQIENLVANDDQQLFQLRFDSSLKDEGTLVGVFTEPLVGGSGGLRLPDVELVGLKIGRRDLFIEPHPGVDLVVHESSGWKGVDAVAEGKRWGMPASEGSEAYEYLGGPMFWGAWVQPQPVTPTVDEQVKLLATHDEIFVRWQARISASGGVPGCQRVQIPEGFTVRKVAIVTGAAEQPYPFATPDERTLLILLTDRLGPDSQLVVEGRVPVRTGDEWRFQRPTVVNSKVQSLTVTLFRAPDVFVEVVNQAGLELVTSVSQPPGDQQLGVFLNAYAARPVENVDLTLRVHANRPTVTAEELIRVTETGGRFQAEIRLDLGVADGILQEMKLELPAQWQIGSHPDEKAVPPSDVKPGWTLTNGFASGYGTGRVKRRLTFTSPQKGRTSVVLLGVGWPDEHGRLSIPWINMEEISDSRYYMILPRSLDWPSDIPGTYGFRRLSEEEATRFNVAANEIAYELTQTAVLPQIACVPSRPIQWEDAEIRVHVSPEGRVLGLLTVWLTGTAEEGCQMRMPNGFHALSAWLDDRSVPVYEYPDGTTYIATDTVTNHRLDVLFRGNLSRDGQRFNLELPQLGGAKSEESGRLFLLLQLASSWTPSATVGESLTAWDYHLTRARDAVERWGQMVQTQGGLPAEKGATVGLIKQYLLARDEARRTLLMAPQTAAVSSAEIRLQNLDLQMSDALQSSVGVEATLASPGAVLAEKLGDATPPRHTHCWYFECDEFPSNISLQVNKPAQKWQDLLIGGAVMVVAGGVSWLIRRVRGQLSIWMMRFAHPVVVLFGIGWWMWLRPGFVGWLLILAALLLLIRSRWRWVPREEATVPLIVQQKLPTAGNPR